MRRNVVALVTLLGLIATACGTASKPAGGTAGQPDPNAVVNIAGPEDRWPPQGKGAGSTTYAYEFNVNVYEPLIYLGSDYTLKPGLAQSWELVNGTTWRFTSATASPFTTARLSLPTT